MLETIQREWNDNKWFRIAFILSDIIGILLAVKILYINEWYASMIGQVATALLLATIIMIIGSVKEPDDRAKCLLLAVIGTFTTASLTGWVHVLLVS